MSAGRRFSANLGLLLFTLALAFACAELALRVMFRQSLDFGMEMWKYAVQLKRPVADSALSFVHAPNTQAFLMGAPVRINSHGQRDSEYSVAKPAGTYRIMILGDSTSFGWGVRQEDTVAKILERSLNGESSGSCRFEVINTGIGNYGTVQEVTYYKTRGRAFHPDLVILQYFINDAEPVPQEKHGVLLDRSYLVAFTTQRLDGLLRLSGKRPDWKEYYSSLYDDNKLGYQAARMALIDLSRMVKDDGSRLLVAILPELHEIDSYPFVDAHNKIKSALNGSGVPVLELIDGLRGHGAESTLWVTPEDAHPNSKANHLIAAQIQTRIAQPDLGALAGNTFQTCAKFPLNEARTKLFQSIHRRSKHAA